MRTINYKRMSEIAEKAISYIMQIGEIEEFMDDTDIDFTDYEIAYFMIDDYYEEEI